MEQILLSHAAQTLHCRPGKDSCLIVILTLTLCAAAGQSLLCVPGFQVDSHERFSALSNARGQEGVC